MSRKKPPLPAGCDAATTPVIKFVSLVQVVDINGKEYEMTVGHKHVKIIDHFSKKVIYEGSDALPGPFGMDGALYILEAIEIWKEAKKS